MVQWLRIRAPNTRGLGSIPCWGARSHMPQLKIPHASAKTRHSQINNKIINIFLKTSLIVFPLPCNLLILWLMLDSIHSVTPARNLRFIFHWFFFASLRPPPHPVNHQVYLVNLLQCLALHHHHPILAQSVTAIHKTFSNNLLASFLSPHYFHHSFARFVFLRERSDCLPSLC